MIYDFYIMTSHGMKNGNVNSISDFSYAPFGYVPYRASSSCECDPQIIEDFWSSVDQVLSMNNLTKNEFIRAVRAFSDGKLYGEYESR